MPRLGLVSTPSILFLSLGLHLVLLLYAEHVDTHPEEYGGLKYTDVDWRVVMDGARLIFEPGESDRARGWFVEYFDLNVGDPYNRPTFRYTPLLPLIMSPSLVQPLLGKLLLTIISLCVPLLLLWDPRASQHPFSDDADSRPAGFWPTHLLWTLNPFVMNITTRGSPEAVIVLLVIATLACLRAAEAAHQQRLANVRATPRAERVRIEDGRTTKWEIRAAVLLALAVSYKIYPAIYVPPIWSVLARRHGWLGLGVWRFGLVAATTVLAVNGVLWSIWGQPFLEHTFLYHLHRLDHRHNFSPYFYPIYLQRFNLNRDVDRSAFSPTIARFIPPDVVDKLTSVLRDPLVSFLPQMALVVIAGFALPPRTSLAFTMFVQTAAFVVWNKVCTSQYFMWFLPLLPPILPYLSITPRRAAVLIGAWVAAQAAWLGTAYQLEFLGREVFLPLWAAGIGLFGVSVWVLGAVVGSWNGPPPARSRVERMRKVR